ncbi:CDP-alcohol phosphatidyltransferase family protein [Rubrivirga sp. IMCC43871]|uniref:CDP-alcohol phosphatidyltransferase family protein n=1 Tax=Rubrivirga sp. IMCC43871 TaxID=3391575 RepID=UPI00398FB70A
MSAPVPPSVDSARPVPNVARPKIAKRRVNDILLGRFERWALPRMAARLPGWVTPDGLTALALGGALLSSVAYALSGEDLAWLHVASFGLVVHWWGDSLDGTLARVRQIRRERYGFFVDHQADAIAAVMLTVGLGAGSLMRFDIAMLICVGVLMMMLLVNMVTIARDVFKISFGGLGPTELRVIAIAFNTIVWAVGPMTVLWRGVEWTVLDLLGMVGVGLLALMWTVSVVRETRLIGRLDPTPPPGQDGQAFDPTGQNTPS